MMTDLSCLPNLSQQQYGFVDVSSRQFSFQVVVSLRKTALIGVKKPKSNEHLEFPRLYSCTVKDGRFSRSRYEMNDAVRATNPCNSSPFSVCRYGKSPVPSLTTSHQPRRASHQIPIASSRSFPTTTFSNTPIPLPRIIYYTLQLRSSSIFKILHY